MQTWFVSGRFIRERRARFNVQRRTHLFQFLGCVRNSPQFPKVAPKQRSSWWTQVCEWTGYQRFNAGNARWRLHPALQPEETLSVSDVTSSFAAIHHHDMDPSIIDPIDYVPTNIPDSPRSSTRSFSRITLVIPGD